MPTRLLLGFWVLILTLLEVRGDSFTVASYNVENYLEIAGNGRAIKSPESRAKVREALKLINADVVALQEIGGTNALLELRRSLDQEGLKYPYWDAVSGHDTNIHVALLSRLPILERRSHTRDSFVLHGRRFQVTRGFEEVVIRVSARSQFTLINAHLKSRRQVFEEDESELRQQEALILRQKIDAVLDADPQAKLLVLGDFNDTQGSPAIRSILGKGRSALVDTRPAELNGDTLPNPNPHFAPRSVTWTHYYGKEDTYSRVDYILLSKTMAKDWVKTGTYVLAFPNWGLASDHRPIVARFIAD